MRLLPAVLLLLLSALSQAAEAACDMHKLAEIPVALKGRRAVVSAVVNGIEGQFIFDSGGSQTIFQHQALKKFSLQAGGQAGNAQLTSSGVVLDVSSAKAKSFEFAGVRYSDETLMVLPENGKYDGLIGQNHLRNADIEYDLAAGAIRLYAPSGCSKTAYTAWAGQAPVYVVDLEETADRQPRTFGLVKVNDVFMRALFDTGSPDTTLQANAARRAYVTPNSPGSTPIEPTYGLNGSVPLKSWSGLFEQVDIGGEITRNQRFMFIDKPNANADIIIGLDFFVFHHIYVSRADHKLYFTANPRLAQTNPQP